MKLLTIFTAAATAAYAFAADPLIINTPSNAVQCEPTKITWEGGVAPYNLFITDVTTSIVQEAFPDLAGHSFTWNTNFPAGHLINLDIFDSSAQEATSGLFTIQDSPDSSCL
ncbi:hypothetical protein BV20DRAFT_973247 [Pilatotrama ljubarskyi]|nr:hypothetical protein BV20DRAFT_973247 [Pilatotrama ljubarskyi]